jgi:hypothetical protein
MRTAKYPKGTQVVARDWKYGMYQDEGVSLEGLVGVVRAYDDGDYAVEWPGLGIRMQKDSHLIDAKNAWRKPGGFKERATA